MRSRSFIRKTLIHKVGCGEHLEARDMLSGHGLAGPFPAAFQNLSSHATAFTSSSAPTVSAGTNSTSATHTVLTAQLTDSSGTDTGTSWYSTSTVDGTTTTLFKVSITGAAADTTLDVSVDGTIIGQITTDANGAGKLVLSSNPQGANEQQLPSNFPTTVAAGSTITVGTASGSLAAPTVTGDSGCGREQAGTTLSAQLTDSGPSATGTAAYWTGTVDGTATTKFKVSVTGAMASSTLDVAVDGTVVGQITTDTSGAGSLVLSSNPQGSEQQLPTDFPITAAAGSSVTVGTLSGTLAASTATTATQGFHSFVGRHRGF
jgi:hypothetical protein